MISRADDDFAWIELEAVIRGRAVLELQDCQDHEVPVSTPTEEQAAALASSRGTRSQVSAQLVR